MAIHSFLKAEKGDPDWQFSPEYYFGKQFKLIDANHIELKESVSETLVLRQNPTEKDLLAKHIKINVQKGSTLELIVINEADDKLQQIFLYDINLKPESTINFGIFVKNGKFNKHIIQINQEELSSFTGFGLIMNTVGGDTEVISKVIHQGPASISHQLIAGIAGEQSQTVYQGMSLLDKNCDNSEEIIDNSNLIIGQGGRCYGKPDIFIDADNISSSQAASTETISDEKLYYLQSRGLDYETAKKIIIFGYQKKILDLIPYSDLQEEIKQMFLP